MPELHRIPIEDLEAELRRRAKGAWRESKPIPRCDECDNFIAYTKNPDTMPEDYNPCALGHEMRFKVLENYIDHNWGFYLRGCKDRQLPEEPSPPAPPSRADGVPATPALVNRGKNEDT